ncbi:MAG TPA: alpha-amylase/4-alpha-glucanotransferase domain-containing protein [Candidatus Omnitrophota bacterium]|nr:alpha-amylase/4-alpha-glucanotransferase domain-containing protein [Candidatus Omnitrophota bacterium]
MKKINLLFGIHCHQPVGNFEHILDESYKFCYLPFIETMARHPRVKFAVHYSGILYDWFENKHPEFLELLAGLVKRGQVEVMTAGYYEPIIPIITDDDKMGQIKMQSDYIKSRFKTPPRGLWLTERIWEPHLPKILSEAGVEYVTVDDYHFFSAGLKKEDLFSYYVTEEQGVTLKVFPINKEMRYLIPFRVPEETVRYLGEQASEDGRRAAILADDGEKFGVWPGTYKWVYEDGYLENLLKQIEANLDWIRPMTFSEYLDEYYAQGTIYLPSASYAEMIEWSGGYFRNFFVKYPESNNMHKKMLMVSNKLQTIKKSAGSDERKKKAAEAERHLYMGQCNCAYWHGVFGGLYLSYLRDAIYDHLIRAENIIAELQRGDKNYTEVVVTDLDRDGSEEVLVSNPFLNVYLSPHHGGSIFEIDYKPKAFNLTNVLTRRKEAYHKKLLETPKDKISVAGSGTPSIHDIVRVKEAGIEKYLVYDRHRRMSLVDHFLPAGTGVEALCSGDYRELGDFDDGIYNFFPQRKNEEASLNLSRAGTVDGCAVKVSKTVDIMAGQSIVNVEYEISNLSEREVKGMFGVEFNLTLLASDAPDRILKFSDSEEKFRLNSSGEKPDIFKIKLIDEWKGFSVSLESEKTSRVFWFPIETVSQSEGGFERTYQGSCFMFGFELDLAPKSKWTDRIAIRMES